MRRGPMTWATHSFTNSETAGALSILIANEEPLGSVTTNSEPSSDSSVELTSSAA